MLGEWVSFNPQIVASAIMAACYAVIFTEKINRAIVSLIGALAMILLGIISEAEAARSIDLNTICLLMGMMVAVGVLEKTGVFQYLAMRMVKRVRANPRALLAAFSALTALLSGYIDNVTTVLLLTPVILQTTRLLEVRSFPFLLGMIFACNIGGAATLIGDPPNILVGSHVGMTFLDFFEVMTPLSYLNVALLIVVMDLIWGRTLFSPPSKRALITTVNERSFISDAKLLRRALAVMALILAGFVFSHSLHMGTGLVAMVGAVAMLLAYTFGDDYGEAEEKVREAFRSIDWVTIFFFAGLFIVVSGLEKTGVLEAAGHAFIEATGGNFDHLLFGFLWISSIVSGIVDNIPFTVTMIPIVETIESSLPGGHAEAMPLWWALLVGACYGGNATLIASSANIVVAGIAAKEKRRVSFGEFMLYGIPITLMSIAVASVYLWIAYR